MKTLSLNIFDIVQNSISAGATEIMINISESKRNDILVIMVKDNGIEINGNSIDNVAHPSVSCRTSPGTGMDFSLLRYQAIMAGGNLKIDSHKNSGTTVIATFALTHFDREPLGDIAGIITILISANPGISFIYKYKTDQGEYRFSSEETKTFLEVTTLNDYNLLNMIGNMINDNLKEICISDMN